MKTAVIIANHGTTNFLEAREGLHHMRMELMQVLPENVGLYTAIINDIVREVALKDSIQRKRNGTDLMPAPEYMGQMSFSSMAASLLSMKEALEQAAEDGYDRIVVFPTIMMDGPLYQAMLGDVKFEKEKRKFREVCVLPPILDEEDLSSANRLADLVARSLHIQNSEKYILIGYETDRSLKKMYQQLQEAFLEHDVNNAYVASLIDRDGLSRIAADLRRQQFHGTLKMQPLTTNSFGHILEEDHGDTRQIAELFRRFGFQVHVIHKGLAAYPEYRQGLIERALEVI
ncbi:sirohydrochlorin cobaltochelatase [Lachnospiraceae bacterium YH-ros2228]